MKASVIEDDATCVLRLARHITAAASIHIDDTGVTLTVDDDLAARALAERLGLRQVQWPPHARQWVGTVGAVNVIVTVGDRPAPVPAQREVA